MEENFIAATKPEILTERAYRYRRATLSLGLLLIALQGTRVVDYSQMSLLGAKLNPGQDDEFVVLTVLWVALAYNALTYAWYLRHEFLFWWHGVQKVASLSHQPQYGLPQLRLYLGFQPSIARYFSRTAGGMVAISDWKLHENGDQLLWVAQKENGERFEALHISKRLKHYVARKLMHFFSADLLLPAAILMGAMGTALISA